MDSWTSYFLVQIPFVDRQEKRPSTVTFSETTPIGVVTQHVKEIHRQFWKDLNGGGDQAAPQGR